VSSRGADGLVQALPCPALLPEARAVARTLTRALPEAGVFVVDADLRIVVFAGALAAARGHDADALIGRLATEAFPAAAGPVRDGCVAALAGRSWQGVHVATRDGVRFAVQTSPLELADGRVAGAVVVLQDATPRDAASADLERRLAQQAAVAELGLRITEGLAGRALDDLAAELCHRAMDADLTSIIEVPADGGDLAVLRAGTGWTPGSIGTVAMPLAPDRIAGYVIRAGGPVLIDDLAADERCSSPLLLEQGMTCGISTPIGNPRAPLGILGAHSRTPRRFTLEDVAFMQSIASLLAGSAERERSARLMQEAQARFRAAFQYAPIGMALFDTSPRAGAPILTQVNDALCAMLGYDADALGQVDPFELSHPDDAYIGVAECLALASGREPSYTVEKRLLRADGSVMHARIRGSIVLGADGEAGYGICQVEDLTETTILRRQEDRIWELSADLLAIIGPGGFVRVSPSWETALGFTADELAALPFEQLIHPEDQQLSSDAFARAVDAPDADTHFECRVRTARGDWRWLAWSARCAERDDDGPVRVYCTARDITDRRETQRALVESLSLFDQSFENAPIGMAIAEPGTGRYLRVNDALCGLLGRSEDELLALESDITGDGTFQTEKRYLRPDGSALWCSLHVTPIRDADGAVTALFGQIIDIDAQ
jgi:PAS domain S-box-containing protein